MFTINCQQCGKPKSVKFKSVAAHTKFCSRTCLADSKREAALKLRQPAADKTILALSRGNTARVSAKDAEWASRFNWFLTVRGYVVHAGSGIPRRQVRLHRAVMERMLGRSLVREEYVDHINHDTTDSRRENLRLATPSLNAANSRITRNSRSGYKGVTITATGRWRGLIICDGVRVNLGLYDDPLDAAYIYDQFAIALFGEFAHTNVLTA